MGKASVACIVTALWCAVAACGAGALAQGTGAAGGGAAPDFTLKDLNGESVRLSDLKGKVVLLAFSTTWCPHCRTAIPGLKELHSRYKEKDFALLCVYIQESKKKISAYVKKYEIPYRVLLDEDGKVANAYGVRGIPSKTLVGKDGTVVCRDCRDAAGLLEKLLGGGADKK